MFNVAQKNAQVILGAIALATALMTWSDSSLAQSSAFAECTFHNATQRSGDQEPVIILGKVPDAPYVVAVLKQDDVTLDTVRQCVPDAFQTRSRSGSYIRAGAFSRRSTAEKLSRYLNTLNLDARVMYLP